VDSVTFLAVLQKGDPTIFHSGRYRVQRYKTYTGPRKRTNDGPNFVYIKKYDTGVALQLPFKNGTEDICYKIIIWKLCKAILYAGGVGNFRK
jgi:hypothetical protein